ncbi:hypothetical protein ACEWY4_004671 [Coilia grayii]|uniref:Uncharacterized protein n=1 Tax=Coilia grayii TaxID=363190 RepID=A0ABD1KMD3_9TELE
METRCNGNRAVIPSLTSGHIPGTAMLKNFVIPRKKRAFGKAALEPCAKESRDYALIESTLRDLILDMGQEPCKWGDAKLVHNEELLREFAEKRSDMRSKGRHLRETEERFCFLVASDQETTEIYQQGLKVAKANQHSLGKPSHGVYLYRHVDVALKSPDYQPATGKNMIVFKVLFGRVKKVTPSSVESATQDPTISFDCHMSRDSVSPRDSLSQQILGSSVFLFDFNEKHELNTRPRQCLPYAVIPIVSMNLLTSVSIPGSPTELPTKGVPKPGPLESLKAFVLAERRGKGESAMVTFKRYGTHGSHMTDQMPREAGAERNVDCQNKPLPVPFLPQQQLQNFYASVPWAGYPPVHPVIDNGQCGSTEVNHPTFLIQQSQICAPRVQSDSFKEGEARISTIVYSSKTVKDPRLSARELGDPNRATSVMQQKLSTMPESNMMNAQKHPLSSQPQVNECTNTTASTETIPRKTQQVAESCEVSVVHKTEKLPSLKLFKMKFQKYQLYFQMTDAERMQHIWSRTDLSLDQKNLLLDRIHFYEHYYEKYKRGLLFSRVTKTDQSLSMERTSEGNVNPAKIHGTSKPTGDESVRSVCLQMKKPGQSESSSTRVQGPFENKQSKEVIATPDVTSEATKHVRPEPTALHLDLNEQEHSALFNGRLINEEMRIGGLTPNTQQPLSSLQVSQVCPESSTQTTKTQREVVSDIRQDVPKSTIEGSPISQSAIETKSTEHLPENEEKDVYFQDGERKEKEESSEAAAFVDEGHFMDVGVCEEVCTMTESEISAAPPMSSPRQEQEVDQKISDASEELMEQEALTNFKNSGKSDNCCKPKTNNSEIFGNTIYNLLYKRLQLTQLLSNSAPTYEKSYLIPQCTGHTNPSDKNSTVNCDKVQAVSDHTDMDVSPVKKSNWEENTMLGITIKGDARNLNPTRKPLTLSERFSLLACSRGEQTLSSLLQDFMLTDRNKRCDTGPTLTKNEEYISSFNIKLVKLLTQKYNEYHGYKTLTKVSDFKRPVDHTALTLTPRRPNSKSTFKKACCLRRHYFQTLPRAVRRTQLYRAVIQNTKDIVLHKEPSCTTETSNEAKLHQSVDALKQSVDGPEQSYMRRVTNSDHSAVGIPCTLPERVSSTAFKQPFDQSQKGDDEKSNSNCSADRTHLEAIPSVTSKDSNAHFPMEGTGNQDKHEVQQKVQEVTDECVSVKKTTCQYNETSAGKDIPTKHCLSDNNNTCSGIEKNDAPENTTDHSTSNSKVKTTPGTQTALQKNAQDPTVHSNMDSNYSPSLDEQKITYGSDTQEVKLISKLRSYLTKFESTVKLQEPLHEIIPEPSHQGVGTPSKCDTAQTLQLLQKQNTEPLNAECMAIVSELNIDITDPGPTGSSLPSNSVSSTSQQNILPVDVSGSATTMCAPNCVTTQSPVTNDPKPDSTTPLGTVLENATQYPLIELSRPKLPPEPQHTQTKTSDGDHHMQSSSKINGQCPSANKPHSRQNGQDHPVMVKPQEAAQGQKLYANALNTIAFQRHYNTDDISDILKEADCRGIDDLHSLVSKAKDMLKYFISNFERDQGAAVQNGIVTRDIILEKYLHQPPAPFDLKYEALNSFLELQMMVEAREFIENKISFLSAKQTFRSLLWYDPSLYGELFKGRVGLQHQSCVYTSFQQGLKMEGYSKLQNYYIAVTTLNQQLMMVPQTSYYLYLKSKREKLEIEAALQNISDCDSFFLSVPVSSMINFGNNLEHLEKLQNCVIAFVETPASNVPGAFDVGKAEHLSIICRFIQEKMHFSRSCKAPNSQVAWFGLEHLLYDASKILVAKDMALAQSNSLPFQGANSNHIYGPQNSWLPVFNLPPQMPQIHGGMMPECFNDDMNRSPLQRSTSDRRHYVKKRKSIGAVDTTPPGVKRRHSYPVMGQNNEHAHNTIQPPMNPINPGQFQPALHSNNLLKQHAALLRRRTQDNIPPPPPTAPTAATTGRQSHSHIRALLLAKQHNAAQHQQSSASGPLPSSTAGLPAVQTAVPPPSITVGAPKYPPFAFQPSYEGVIRRVPEKSSPQHAVALKQSKNPFTLGPVPSLQIPPSLCAPRPPALHSSNQFTSSLDKASALPEPTPLNYPFFLLNGCTYTSSNSSSANQAAPNDKS